MITFSKNSWHYKLYLKMYGKYSSVPNSICPYFWKVVWALAFEYLIKWVMISIVAVFAVVAVCGVFSFPFIVTSTIVGETSTNTLWGLPIYHWKIIIFDIVCWAITFGICCIVHLFKNKKEASLVVEWTKAKKQKICPIIKFEDSEEE